MELFCAHWGKPGFNRLVLLHGLGGTGSLWRPIAATLENEFEILAPDQRGHGKSRVQDPADQSFDPTHYGQDIVDTLRLKSFYPAWLVGHSMGVRTAVAAAHLSPELVLGLVLVDLGLSGAAGGGLGDDLADFIQKLPLEFSSRSEAKEFMAKECPDASIGQYLMAVSVQNISGQNSSGDTSSGRVTFPFDHAALIATIEAARQSNIRDPLLKLASNGMPILFLRGEQSRVWTHDEFLKEQKHFAPYSNAQFVEVAGAGHGLPFEKRAEFVTVLKDFVRERTLENGRRAF